MQLDSKLQHTDLTADPGEAHRPSRPTTIRPATFADVPALKSLIDAVGLFPSEMLDGMMASYFDNPPLSESVWLTDDDNEPVGIAYYAPERLTEGTWNLYLIAIHPERQRQGRGAALLHYVEDALRAQSQRILLVETSGLPDFEYQRTFYKLCGYDEEARIRDFYQVGEDKVIFRKALVSSRASTSSIQ